MDTPAEPHPEQSLQLEERYAADSETDVAVEPSRCVKDTPVLLWMASLMS
jgi:hypothetical protein